MAYHRRGELLVLNTDLVEEGGKAFELCREWRYWYAPTNKKPFQDHKTLHDRRKLCNANGQRYHLGYQFSTDVLLVNFRSVPEKTQAIYANRYGVSEEAQSRQRLDDLAKRLTKRGVQFAYSFDEAIHDRFIETDDWQIMLGRGLDMYYPPDRGRPLTLQARRTKKCRIIYLPKQGRVKE